MIVLRQLVRERYNWTFVGNIALEVRDIIHSLSRHMQPFYSDLIISISLCAIEWCVIVLSYEVSLEFAINSMLFMDERCPDIIFCLQVALFVMIKIHSRAVVRNS